MQNYSLFLRLPLNYWLDLKDPHLTFHLSSIENKLEGESIYLGYYLHQPSSPVVTQMASPSHPIVSISNEIIRKLASQDSSNSQMQDNLETTTLKASLVPKMALKEATTPEPMLIDQQHSPDVSISLDDE